MANKPPIYGLGGSSFLALNNWPENNEVESVNNGAMGGAYNLVFMNRVDYFWLSLLNKDFPTIIRGGISFYSYFSET